MTPLAQKLRDDIQKTGPITLAQYVELCLQDPAHGYYTTGAPLGADGDFTTAPEISQMFGELLGLALAQAWLDQGAPSPFALAELGPGRGTLMADLLRATRTVPGFHAAARIVFVETSPRLKTDQAKAVPQAKWVDQLKDVPALPLFLIANEFFDALPAHQFLREGQAWRERLVGLQKGQLAFGWSEPIRQRALAHRLADTADGAIVELSPATETLAQQIAHRLSERGGAALIVDYGDWRSLGDTFQALHAHQSVDPLACPGEADLTFHVDFAALSQALSVAAQVSAPVAQGVFLERLGITARAQQLAQSLSGPKLEAHIAAHRRLTHPDEMGHLFKVLGAVPRGAAALPGLDSPFAAPRGA